MVKRLKSKRLLTVPKSLKRVKSIVRTRENGKKQVGVAQMVNSIILDLQLTVVRLQLKLKTVVTCHLGVDGVDGVDVMVLRDTELEIEQS
jgi:hypothetical protein